MPLERDEGEFAYVGQLMLQGIPPYKIASNMKLPGTYAAYAAIMAVFGETPSGIRIGLMLVNIAATVLVFLLAKYLYGWLAGTVAGMTYSSFPAAQRCWASTRTPLILCAGSPRRNPVVAVCHRHQADQHLFRQRALLRTGVPDEAARNSVRCLRRIVLAVAAMEEAFSLAQYRPPRRRAICRYSVAVRSNVSAALPCRGVSELLVLDLVLCARIWTHNNSAGREERVARLLAVGHTPGRDLGDRCHRPCRPVLEPLCRGHMRGS